MCELRKKDRDIQAPGRNRGCAGAAWNIRLTLSNACNLDSRDDSSLIAEYILYSFIPQSQVLGAQNVAVMCVMPILLHF